jgi:hypothetical protein
MLSALAPHPDDVERWDAEPDELAPRELGTVLTHAVRGRRSGYLEVIGWAAGALGPIGVLRDRDHAVQMTRSEVAMDFRRMFGGLDAVPGTPNAQPIFRMVSPEELVEGHTTNLWRRVEKTGGPLHWAARLGDAAALAALLPADPAPAPSRQRAEIVARWDELTADADGNTPVEVAAIAGRVDCLRLLAEAYDIPVQSAARPADALVAAVEHDQLKAAAWLLRSGGASHGRVCHLHAPYYSSLVFIHTKYNEGRLNDRPAHG